MESIVGKPVALMSASPNRFGGAFAQSQPGDMLRRAGADVLTDLEVAVGFAHHHLDDAGILLGEEPRRDIAGLRQRVLTRVTAARRPVPA